MPSFVLRDIDPDLWEKVRNKLKQDKIGANYLITVLLKAYVNNKITVEPRP